MKDQYKVKRAILYTHERHEMRYFDGIHKTKGLEGCRIAVRNPKFYGGELEECDIVFVVDSVPKHLADAIRARYGDKVEKLKALPLDKAESANKPVEPPKAAPDTRTENGGQPRKPGRPKKKTAAKSGDEPNPDAEAAAKAAAAGK